MASHRYKTFSDHDLITLLQKSDRAAYTEIYRRYYYLMFVIACKKLKEEGRTKDFVQELFTNVWVKRAEILPAESLAPYLYVSLRNRIIDHVLHQDVESKYIDSFKDYVSAGHTANAGSLESGKQVQFYIEKEIQALPAKWRKAFELTRKNNLSDSETAEKPNTTESTISQYIKILRTKLSSILVFVTLGTVVSQDHFYNLFF